MTARSAIARIALYVTVLSFSVFLTMIPSSPAQGGGNPNATFVLHAQSGLTGDCTTGMPNCITGRPTVNVQPNSEYRVFFYVNNVNEVGGVQTAFQWDPSWELLGSSWNCQGGQMTAAEPDTTTNGGPISGTIVTVFDCVTVPGPLLIGYMDFLTGPGGCLFQVNSELGNQKGEVIDCENQEDLFDVDADPSRFGRICVASGGHDACDPPASPPPGIIDVQPPLVDFGETGVYTCNEAVVQLRNEALDPTSVLHVTQFTVSGAGFGLLSGPTLPLDIPADGTVVAVILRFCARAVGVNTGVLTVSASNGSNSPLRTPLTAHTIAVAFQPDALLINFSDGAMTQPAPDDGPLDAFQFTIDGLWGELDGVDIVALRKLLPGFTQESVQTTNALGEEIILVDMSRIYVALLAAGSDVGDAINHLRDREGIGYVGPSFEGSFQRVPNDPVFQDGLQWGLHNTGSISGASPDVDINAPEAWDLDTGGAAARIGVIDSGADLDHADLLGRLEEGFNFRDFGAPPEDDYGHGTAVTGIIGATGNNGAVDPVGRVVGVNWSARLVPYKISIASTPSLEAVNAAMFRAVQDGVPIANLSLGSSVFEQTLYQQSLNAAAAGLFVVASMGGRDDSAPRYPAAHEHLAFAVGALWLDGSRWVDADLGIPGGGGSSFGPWIDAVAPGGAGIATTKLLDDYFDLDPGPGGPGPTPPVGAWDGFGGTSAATAFVSGTAGLLASYNRNLIGDDFGQVLRRTARHIPQYGARPNIYTGYGLIRADSALNFVSPPRRVQHYQSPPLNLQLVSHPSPEIRVTFLNLADHGYVIPDGTYSCEVYEGRNYFSFDPSFQDIPDLWYRYSGTRGWRRIADFETYDMRLEASHFAYTGSLTTSGVWAWTYFYRVSSGEYLGTWFPGPPTDFPVRIAITAVGPVSGTGIADQLFAASRVTAVVTPNPAFRRIQFLLNFPYSGRVSLRIYDVGGRLVRILSDEPLSAGTHILPWDGRNGAGHNIATGVYFWQLEVNGERVKRDKVVITR